MKQTIVLGISGGIAAYKSAQLTSELIKKGYDVEVIMTQHATQFIAPLTFETLTKHHVMLNTFEKGYNEGVEHINMAKRADIFVIVPATSNIISKIAHGMADDMLTTTFLAAQCPKILCPAMNTAMYQNPITQQNIRTCQSYGMDIVEPEQGLLACGDVGEGKLANIEQIIQSIETNLHTSSLLQGINIMISAGPTQEAMDPVRFISNHSSGKMGYELAKAARNLGANVTLISGPVSLPKPSHIHTIEVTSAQDMFNAIKEHYETQDIIIKAAAVGDYRPITVAEQKIKKTTDSLTLTLVKNPDILAYLGEHKQPHQIICGFAMETDDLLKHAKEKMIKKHCDMLVANHLKVEGAGFQVDTNVVSILQGDQIESLEKMTKGELAKRILHKLHELYIGKGESKNARCN